MAEDVSPTKNIVGINLTDDHRCVFCGEVARYQVLCKVVEDDITGYEMYPLCKNHLMPNSVNLVAKVLERTNA